MSTPSSSGPATQTMPTPAVDVSRPASSVPAGVSTVPVDTAPAGVSSGAAPVAAAAPSGATTSTAAATSSGHQAGAPVQPTPRRVRLAVSRVDPWSVLKMSFLFSVALGIAGVVMTAVLWSILQGMGVFTNIDRIIQENQLASADPIHILDYVGFKRVVSLSVLIGVINIFLMTALSTLASFLYNISSSLVGGLQLTLTDE